MKTIISIILVAVICIISACSSQSDYEKEQAELEKEQQELAEEEAELRQEYEELRQEYQREKAAFQKRQKELSPKNMQKDSTITQQSILQ